MEDVEDKNAEGAEVRGPDAGPIEPAGPAPAGRPGRPLLEAGLVFAAFWLSAYLPADPSQAGAALGSPGFHLGLLVQLLPKALFLLYLMSRSEGLAGFGLRPLRASDLGKAIAAAGACLAIALLPGLASALSGGRLDNPLLAAAGRPAASPFLVVPLVAASALAVGYGEELFFRAYLMRRLGQAGLPLPWAGLASALVFGSAHGLQGLLGLLVASALGGFLAWRWARGRNIHEIALGHALYDFLVMAAALYAGT